MAERLADVARSLHSEGLEEQAQSIETTVADLDWQCEEFASDSADAAVAVARDRFTPPESTKGGSEPPVARRTLR